MLADCLNTFFVVLFGLSPHIFCKQIYLVALHVTEFVITYV